MLTETERSTEVPESADLFGWFVGSWDLEIYRYAGDDMTASGVRGEVHAEWALEGRAVQDVWIMPRRADRTPSIADRRHNMYGTTLRVWDPAIAAWRITWINPVSGRRNELVARRIGADIVLVGTHPDGTPIRWTFTDIEPNAFHWLGHALEPDGRTWRLEGEFRGRRIAQ